LNAPAGKEYPVAFDALPAILREETLRQEADGYRIVAIGNGAVNMMKRVKPPLSGIVFHAIFFLMGWGPLYLLQFMNIYFYFRGTEYRFTPYEHEGEVFMRMRGSPCAAQA